jgi:spore maturation protein CgeB
VDLYGGDPAWIHGMEQSRFFPSPQVVHHPPMFDPTEVIELFRTTRVNLNISALQFDHAVVNRVLDCAAAGGFLLTDKKAVLSELTGLAEEISYASPAELQEKVRYFLDPAHDPQRREIAWQLREDLQASCGLEKTLQYMLGKMHDFSRPGRE